VQRGNVNVRGGSAGALGRGPPLHQPQLQQARPQPDKSARTSAGGERIPLQSTPTPSSASGRAASNPEYGARGNEAATSSTAPRAPVAQPGIGGGPRHNNMFNRAPIAHPNIGHSRVGSPGSRDNIAHHHHHHHHHHHSTAAPSGKSNKSSPRGHQVTPKASSEFPQRLTPPTQRLSQDLRGSSDSAPNFESPEKTTPPSSGVRYHTASDPGLRGTSDSQLHSRASVNGTTRPHHLRCAGTPSGVYQHQTNAHHVPMHPTPSAPKARQPVSGGPPAGDAESRTERQLGAKGSGLMQSGNHSSHSPSHGSHQRGLAQNLQIPNIQSATLQKRYICISPLKDHCSAWLTHAELRDYLVRERVSFEKVSEGSKGYLKKWDAKDAEQHGRQNPPSITEAQLVEIWEEAADTVDTQRRPDGEASGGRAQHQQQRVGGHEHNTEQFTMSEEEKCKLLAHTISYFHKMIRTDPFHASLENYNEKDRQIRTETFEQFKEENKDASASFVSEFIIQILQKGAYEVVNFVMGVYYMAKFKGATRVPLHSQTWRNLFITSLVISDKMWEDVPAKNSNVVKFFGQEQGLDKKRLASMEHKFLEALDFRLSARTNETAGVGTEGILEQWDPWMADMRKTAINPEIEQRVNKYFGQQDPQTGHVNREPRSPSPTLPSMQFFRPRDNLGGLGKGRQLSPYINRQNDEMAKAPFYPKSDIDGEGASSRVEPSSSRTEPTSSDRANSLPASESRALLKQPQPGPTNPMSTRSTLPSRTGPMVGGKGGAHGPNAGSRAANSRNPTSRVASRQQIPTAAPTPPKSASSTAAQGSSGPKSLHGTVSAGQPETFLDASRRGLTMNAGEGTSPGLGLGSFNRSGRSSSPSSTGIVSSKDDRSERGRALANGTSHTSTSPGARGMHHHHQVTPEANGTTSHGLQLGGGVRVSSSSTGAMNTARGTPTSAALNPTIRGNSHGNLTAQPTVRGGAQVRASQGAPQSAGQGHASARLQPPASSYPFQPSGRASQSRAAPASMMRHQHR